MFWSIEFFEVLLVTVFSVQSCNEQLKTSEIVNIEQCCNDASIYFDPLFITLTGSFAIQKLHFQDQIKVSTGKTQSEQIGIIRELLLDGLCFIPLVSWAPAYTVVWSGGVLVRPVEEIGPYVHFGELGQL